MFAILKNWHPMIGRDLHICNLPPPAPPVPGTPYVTFSILGGPIPFFPTQKYFKSHPSSGFGITMAKGTDCGSLIPHCGPPSITLMVEMAFSSSKSHFGASSYQGVDNSGAQNSVAVAALGFTNLNRGTPAPVPFGQVIGLNTHMAQMSVGDFVGGLLSMGFDYALQRVMNGVTNAAQNALKSGLARLGFRYFATSAAAKAAAREMVRSGAIRKAEVNVMRWLLLSQASPWGRHLDSPWTGAALGFIIGSPTGADLSNVPGCASVFSAASDVVSPSGPEQDPSPPPPIPDYSPW